ncbi:2OG-Fe(II) oxygenase [Cognatiluteimonas profundi]|uniref:2OG-Fe(II) oxygenase n=1 Tax=Cognatiluteimonas profundi TaxID=2594501 RepID=UPI00131C09A8|nr:2OG-Fe(II) oxygenase [Lysobacter profundi]
MTPSPDVERLRREAANGAPEALHALAMALIVEEEAEQAHDHMRVAAQAGHAGAQVELARMHLYAVGTDVDVPQAVDWLQRAERAQHPGASYALASIALGGIGLERDFEVIGHRLLTAAKGGLVPAMRALAMYFGRERDNLAAMRQSEALLAQAAARRDPVSAALLAERIRQGEVVSGARYALGSLDALARSAGIHPMPPLQDRVVANNGDDTLQLDLESSMRAPAFVARCPAPLIATAEGLLTAEECRYVIAMGSPHLIPSQVEDPASATWIKHPARSSHDAALVPILEDFQLRLLQLRMAAGIGMDFTCAEPMVVLHYRPGQEYLPHRDYLTPELLAANQPEAGQRAATLCCYLNNVEAGGETIFPKPDRMVRPRVGRAVAFRNLDDAGRPDPDSLHAGLPVQAGEKWLATLWVRERRHRDF